MKNRCSHPARAVLLFGLLTSCTTVSDGTKGWSAATQVDEQGDAFTVAVGMDADGTAIALSDSASLAKGSIFARRGVRDRDWDTAEQIDRNVLDAFVPSLSVNLSGDAIAVWTEGLLAVDGRLTIWANRFTAGEGWGSPVRLDRDTEDSASDPDVAVDSNGDGVAVWHQSDGTLENIWASRSVSDGTWSAPELIETNDDGHAGDPRIAVDSKGNAIAVWHQFNGTQTDIWANRFTLEDGWGTAERIEINDRGPARNPRIAMDPDGNAVVVWHQSDGELNEIWSSRFAVSGEWSPVARIGGDDAGNADSPDVGLDAEGRATAVWKQFDGISTGVWSNHFTPAGGWSDPVRIEANDDGDALAPRVAVSKTGDAVVVWAQSDGSRLDVWSNSYTPTNGWGPAGPIDPDSEDQGQSLAVALAIDPRGRAIAVWTRVSSEDLGGGGTVWTARYE